MCLPEGPVFIGGTGRSGTWVLGRMLAAHPRWTTVRTELRFHADPPGFAAVISGEMTPSEFAELVEHRWYGISGAGGQAKGLQILLARDELRARLQEFVARADGDVPGALGQLMLDVVGRHVAEHGAVGWAETTPYNAAAAGALTSALPACRVVHTIRDGRDVAASVLTMPWGPGEPTGALEWWAGRMRLAQRGLDAAHPGRVHTVRFEELIHLDRDGTFNELVEFLGFRDHERLRRYFDIRMTPEASHVGRWRQQVPETEQAGFDRHYRELLTELDAEGVEVPVHPDAADEIAASTG